MRVSPAVVMQMHRDGYNDQQIADQTGAALDNVAAIITTHKNLVARGSIPEPKPAPAALDAVALLAWASAHSTPAVRRDAERALTALEALGVRHKAEAELEAVSSAVAELEQRLKRLKARESDLRGSRPAKGPRPPVVRDYVPSAVRAWAREAGVECPVAGVLPSRVVDAWRAAATAVSQ